MWMNYSVEGDIAAFSKEVAPVRRQMCPELSGHQPHIRMQEDYIRDRFQRKAGTTLCRATEQTKERPSPIGPNICQRCVQVLQKELKFARLANESSTRSILKKE